MTEEPKTDGPDVVDVKREPEVFVDWIITAGSFEGVANITLGTVDYLTVNSQPSAPQVVVTTKMRMSLPFAKRLGEALIQISAKTDEQTEQGGDDDLFV